MKTFWLILLILLSGYSGILSQKKENEPTTASENTASLRLSNYQDSESFCPENAKNDLKLAAPSASVQFGAEKISLTFPKAEIEKIAAPKTDDKKIPVNVKPPQQEERETEKFHWKPALAQSFLLLGIQHGFRMTEQKTRRELDGPFFRDWKESVKNLRGWDDGNKFFTNYIAHPMQGAVTGRIFINNSERDKKLEFSNSARYWKSRLNTMIWSTVWSTQFEIGPISEASLGNVGQKLDGNGRCKLTWGDIVITPTMGTAWVVGEDAIDKYVLRKWIERKIQNKSVVRVFRSVLTPMTTFGNLIRFKQPWKRDTRY